MGEPSKEAELLPSIGEVIERIGLGSAQLKFALLGGGVWLADGSELLLIGSATRAVSKEWNMSAWQRASTVSVVFLGILLGNAICGPLGDRHGRRLPIIISYLGICIFSALSACTMNFYQLALVRVLVGAAFGIGQPAFNTLCSEITPTRWRILVSSGSGCLFIIGELYSALLIYLDDPAMKELNWRRLLLLGAIPSVFGCVLSARFLQQSPYYLAEQGKHEEARQVLEFMRLENDCVDVNLDFRTPTPKPKRTLVEVARDARVVIFSRKLGYSTIVVIYTTFMLNVVFYGCLYAFPQVLAEVDMNASPAVSLIVGALWEIPGQVLAIVWGMFLPRRVAMALYLVAISASLVAFGAGTSAGLGTSSWFDFFLLHSGFIGIKFFAVVGFVVTYQYSTEIYPTMARTTGSAACLAGGRLGGMLAPLIFEMTVVATGHISAFFYVIAVLCGFNLCALVFLPFETFGKSLDEHDVDEVTPLANP